MHASYDTQYDVSMAWGQNKSTRYQSSFMTKKYRAAATKSPKGQLICRKESLQQNAAVKFNLPYR